MAKERVARVLEYLSILFCSLFLSVLAADAATFTVNSTADAADVNPGDGVCAAPGGVCTLRAAIMEANRVVGVVGGEATIILPAETYTLTIPTGADDETTGDLDIFGFGSMSIVGAGSSNTIVDGNSFITNSRVFHIDTFVTVNISGVTIRNGVAPPDFFTQRHGGGIRNDGTLTLTDSTVNGNSALGSGGGIFNTGPGTLTLINSTVSGNSAATNFGGGIFNSALSATIINSTVSGNSARSGGGIGNNGGTLKLINSTVSGNSATGAFGPNTGGGIYLGLGTVTLINSTVSGNSSRGNGGGISNGDPPSFVTGTLNIFNSTITRNTAGVGTAAGVGGGVFHTSTSVTTFQNTIVAGNRVVINLVPLPVLAIDDCAGTIHSDGNNLMGVQNCTVTGAAPLVADPQLGSLQNNGGPTQTHALAAGSPAIDVGDCTLGPKPSTDQRGFRRTIDGNEDGTLRCDIGAYEFGAQLLSAAVEFDGDGKSDILWRHDSGAVAIWLMNGFTIQSSSLIGTPGNDWHIADSGDFNGDGKSDILWRHDSGAVAIWLMNGFAIQSFSLVGMPGNDWHIANTGDFNADGRSDILWRHDSGAVAIWLMNGFAIQSFSLVGTAGNDWHIADSGDFNNDGRSDILWRHDSGAVAIWLMNGFAIQSFSLIGTAGNDWHIADTGDFNADGKSDILWRHDSGAVAIWLMNGFAIQSSSLVGTPGNDWHIADTGDFNGDGKSDILWRHDSGAVAIWLMNGFAIQSFSLVGTPGNDWHIATN